MPFMKPKSASILIALWVVSPQTADAKWQWTDWGMSRSQVEDAAKSHSIAMSTSPYSTAKQVELNAPYATLGLQFTARFIFNDQDSLYLVVLKQADKSQCLLLKDLMKSSYAAPYDTHRSGDIETLAWRDEAGGNDVTFGNCGPSDYPGSWCEVKYGPLADHKKLGL